MSILRLFLSLQGKSPSLPHKILGCVFLFSSGLGATFFLFQALAPIIGYLESGALACTSLGVLGGSLLFIDKKQQTSIPEEAVSKITSFLKEFNIENTLKNNVVPVSLVFLGVGFALSQMKNIKRLSDVYKILR